MKSFLFFFFVFDVRQSMIPLDSQKFYYELGVCVLVHTTYTNHEEILFHYLSSVVSL